MPTSTTTPCTHTEVSPEHLEQCCGDGFDCDECGQTVTTPVRDPGQVAFLGDRARVFCSAKCLADAAERQGSR